MDIPILSAKPLKFETKFLCTVTRGRDLLEFQRVFSTNQLIKTYVTLCESCRSIAPLQLLFLDIFKYDDTFWSFIILKTESRNKIGSGDIDVALARAHVRVVVSTWHLSRSRCTVITSTSPWTCARIQTLRLTISPYATPMQAASVVRARRAPSGRPAGSRPPRPRRACAGGCIKPKPWRPATFFPAARHQTAAPPLCAAASKRSRPSSPRRRSASPPHPSSSPTAPPPFTLAAELHRRRRVHQLWQAPLLDATARAHRLLRRLG
jgi:hypothetical protein